VTGLNSSTRLQWQTRIAATPKQPEASLIRDPATDYLPLRQEEARATLLVEWNVEHGGPLRIAAPLASDIFTERHERTARKAGEAMSLRFLGRCVPAGWIVLSLIAAAFSAQPYRPMTW